MFSKQISRALRPSASVWRDTTVQLYTVYIKFRVTTYACVYVRAFVCVCLCVNINMFLYVCVCINMCSFF